jgi:photosystem II stability/assembly factor-like uncharacterized protein
MSGETRFRSGGQVRRGWRLASAVTAAVLACLAATSARANGRYPMADQIVVDPGNFSHLVARATFGLLDSDDGGRTFRWVCERAVGYFGIEDPPIAVTADGSIVVASSKGISVSADGGCTWIRNAGIAGTWYGVDVTVVPARPHEALALLSSSADGVYTTSIFKTSDDGVTWEALVTSLGRSFLATTLEVAPSNPERIYVSGRVLPEGTTAMLRSDDGGHTWAQFSLELSVADSVFIGAVDPRNADVVYLRSNGDDIGRVLVTGDGAVTWREVWQAPSDVSGFALSPDGSTLAVGGSNVGVSVASTADHVFRKTSEASVYCLTFWGDKLLVCTKEAIDHFSIGISDDLGEHFAPLLHLGDVLPRSCAADASAGVCALEWSDIATAIGADAGARSTDAGNTADRASGGGCDCSLRPLCRSADRSRWWLAGLAIAMAGARMRRAGARRALRSSAQYLP